MAFSVNENKVTGIFDEERMFDKQARNSYFKSLERAIRNLVNFDNKNN